MPAGGALLARGRVRAAVVAVAGLVATGGLGDAAELCAVVVVVVATTGEVGGDVSVVATVVGLDVVVAEVVVGARFELARAGRVTAMDTIAVIATNTVAIASAMSGVRRLGAGARASTAGDDAASGGARKGANAPPLPRSTMSSARAGVGPSVVAARHSARMSISDDDSVVAGAGFAAGLAAALDVASEKSTLVSLRSPIRACRGHISPLAEASGFEGV